MDPMIFQISNLKFAIKNSGLSLHPFCCTESMERPALAKLLSENDERNHFLITALMKFNRRQLGRVLRYHKQKN